MTAYLVCLRSAARSAAAPGVKHSRKRVWICDIPRLAPSNFPENQSCYYLIIIITWFGDIICDNYKNWKLLKSRFAAMNNRQDSNDEQSNFRDHETEIWRTCFTILARVSRKAFAYWIYSVRITRCPILTWRTFANRWENNLNIDI